MWIYPPPNVITELERPERQTLTAKFLLLLFRLMRTTAGGFLGWLWESNGIERVGGGLVNGRVRVLTRVNSWQTLIFGSLEKEILVLND